MYSYYSTVSIDGCSFELNSASSVRNLWLCNCWTTSSTTLIFLFVVGANKSVVWEYYKKYQMVRFFLHSSLGIIGTLLVDSGIGTFCDYRAVVCTVIIPLSLLMGVRSS